MIAAAIAMMGIPAKADPIADFYRGKTMRMLIGYGPGGGYDIYGRLVAEFLPKHLPGNPTIVAQNMPGAGSYVAASHLYAAAPKDGTVFGIIARDAALGPLSNAPGARFDATKLSWLGSPTREHNVCIANAGAKVKSVAELRQNELILGDTGPGTGTRSYPKVLNDLFGYQFKLVSGFRSSADVFLAMERGEVDGLCGLSWSTLKSKHHQWLKDKKINLISQASFKKVPEIGDVPLLMEQTKDTEKLQILKLFLTAQEMARPFAAPPGIPADRKAALVAAFDATMKDPEFLAEAEKLGFEVDPVLGEKMQKIVEKVLATPKDVAAKAKGLLE